MNDGMKEKDRIIQKIDQASDDTIKVWQQELKKRLFDCGFDGGRKEFKRLVSNAYVKFQSYREEICDVVGVKSDAELDRLRQKHTLVYVKKSYRLTKYIFWISAAMLLVGLATLSITCPQQHIVTQPAE